MSAALRRNLLTLALFACISVAFSWPLVLAPASSLVSRQVDAYGMVWLASQAPALSLPFRSEAVAWPVGQDLGWCDSYLFLFIARLLGLWRAPVLALGLFTLVGPVLSAWAAERVSARLLGVRWPWSLLAGLGYGFSGVMVTALLEGHLYALLNPWLPLLCWAWARALGSEGRLRHGLFAGLAWAACLLTSAYVGLAGALLVLAMGTFLLRRGCTRWRPIAAAAGVSLPLGLAYMVAMARVDPVAPTASLPPGLPDRLVPGDRRVFALHGPRGRLDHAPAGRHRAHRPGAPGSLARSFRHGRAGVGAGSRAPDRAAVPPRPGLDLDPLVPGGPSPARGLPFSLPPDAALQLRPGRGGRTGGRSHRRGVAAPGLAAVSGRPGGSVRHRTGRTAHRRGPAGAAVGLRGAARRWCRARSVAHFAAG